MDRKRLATIVLTSNIDFVLVGPHDDRDAVLVRSSNAGADLVGFAVERGLERDLKSFPDSLHPLLLALRPWQKMMNLVVSHEIAPNKYIRHAHYLFAWVGYCSRSDRISIEKNFNKRIHSIDEIRRSTFDEIRSREEDLTGDEVEWQLAPIVYECYKAHKNARRKLNLAKWVMWAYAIIVGFSAMAALVGTVVTR